MELVGIGNALIDVIASVEPDFAPSVGFHSGSTNHIPYNQLREIVKKIPDPSFVAGGGALNTCCVASLLGIRSAFVGVVGDDAFGSLIKHDLLEDGVAEHVVVKNASTGMFLSILSEDGRRTVFASPEAAEELKKEDIPDFLFLSNALLYIDGFLAKRESLFKSCLMRGKEAGMKIVLDTASFSLVKARFDLLSEAIRDYCALVFMNEDEACAFLGGPIDPHRLGKYNCRFIIKRAERGAVYIFKDLIVESPVRSQLPFDKTGAGDAFAAGFIAAFLRELSPEHCLRLGNRVAEEAIRVPGCSIDPHRLKIALNSVL